LHFFLPKTYIFKLPLTYMTLKHILYTSIAALAMLAPTTLTGIVANAATDTAQTAQVVKTADNKQTANTAITMPKSALINPANQMVTNPVVLPLRRT
ncbi:MAG: hypothetical protein ABF441_04695, partial [Lentilactobacillus hilgardii]